MAKKICFVLGAGGARGIAHIGFLQAMEENNIRPDYIVGCSMGAVVGACYSIGISPSKMKAVAEELKFKDIVDLNLKIFTKKSILHSVKMRNKIASLLENKSFSDTEIPFTCVAVDLISGSAVALNEGCLVDAVCASSAIPTIFRPVEMNGMDLVDGGVLERVPVKFAKEFNADVIVAVDVLGKLQPYTETKSVLGHLLRTLDVVDCYNTEKYLKKYKPDVLVYPELKDMSQYKVEMLSFAYEEGYKAGLKVVSKIKRKLEK
ncbi:MAG: patatin-like phospholipase family protein [Clostridia bacterium]|jgi:NTE family protein|nr:patatin-like phospholipase family protein [Clostridia bacterium]